MARVGNRRNLGVSLFGLLLSGVLSAAPLQAAGPVQLPLEGMGFTLRPLTEGAVSFHGVNDSSAGAGAASSMLYQIPAGAGIAGLFVAMLAHGGTSEAVRQHEISRAAKAADAVLLPYQGVTQNLQQRELMRDALAQLSSSGPRRLLENGEAVPAGWVIESVPVYSLTQDQRALVLDNAVIVRDSSAKDPVYQTIVHVVSDARPDAEPQQAWLAEEGQALKTISVQLYAHSLHIVLRTLAEPPKPTISGRARTFRYFEGGKRKFERAKLLSLACARAVVQTLRGELMSIPQAAEEIDAIVEEDAALAPAACEAARPYPS